MTPPAATARSAARVAPGVRRVPVRHPRRISGPARPALTVPAPGSAVLDRLIRGRAWIGLLAFALIGIVAMQMLVLELNTGIGRTLGRVATLQRANAQLSIEDSMYSAESRVAPQAAAAGMRLAPPGTVHFVASSPADVAHAAAALSTAIQAGASGASSSAGTSAGEPAASTEAPPTSAPATSAETGGSSESSTSASPGG